MSEATSGALFETEFTTDPPRWYGRVVSSETWSDNIEGENFEGLGDIKGWGYRYKVRIFGWHTGDQKTVSDNKLVMANVVMPVTAGSGQGGARQTPSLTAGAVVTGFFMDGMGGQEPYIDGVLGNSNNETPKKQPEGKTGGYQQFNDTYKDGSAQKSAKVPDDLIHKDAPLQTFDSVHLSTTKAYIEQDEDRRIKEHIVDPCQKKSSDLKGIQLAIEKLVATVEKIKKTASAVSSTASEILSLVQAVIKDACGIIARYIKNILKYVLAFILDKLAELVKKIIPRLFPTLIPKITKLVNKGVEKIVCLFNKLIDALLDTICDLLNKNLDKQITTPECVADNFVSDYLGSILDSIVGVLDDVLGSIGAVASGISSVASSLDFIIGILDFFKCESEMSCSGYDCLSLSGPPHLTLDLPSFSRTPGVSVPPGQRVARASGSNCNTGPKPCKGPEAQFSIGNGVTAAANIIVSPVSSSVIAFDIKNRGSGYSTAPFVDIVDPCGKGSGASGKVNMDGGSVKNITVTSPGDKYLPGPDGSLGGNGITWKEKNEGYVETKDGTYYVVPPNTTPTLNDGDKFFPPPVETPVQTPVEPTYPVLLEIEEVEVFDPGFGYCDTDQLVITPNNGAILEPVIVNGRIESVKVINGGLGFADLPEITTNADSCGYNFEAVPILRVVDPETVDQIPPTATIINVVDCVGKIPPKQIFDINPR